MAIATISNTEEYNAFTFKEGQVFEAGELKFEVININGKLGVKDRERYGGEIKVDGQQDAFQWVLECGYTLTQVK